MKNRTTLMAAVIGMMLVTGACSNGGSTASDTASGSPASPQASSASSQTSSTPAKKVTLSFWGAIGEANGPKDVVDAWNKANPDIQVQYVRYVNDNAGNTKLDTALMRQPAI